MLYIVYRKICVTCGQKFIALGRRGHLCFNCNNHTKKYTNHIKYCITCGYQYFQIKPDDKECLDCQMKKWVYAKTDT